MLITKFWSAFSDTFSRQKLVKKTFFFFHGNVTDLSKAWIIAGPYCVNCELSSGIPSASKITKRLYYGRLQIMPHVNSENIIFFSKIWTTSRRDERSGSFHHLKANWTQIYNFFNRRSRVSCICGGNFCLDQR